MFALYAVDSHNRFTLIRKSADVETLDWIVERNDGICWLNGEAHSFQIILEH